MYGWSNELIFSMSTSFTSMALDWNDTGDRKVREEEKCDLMGENCRKDTKANWKRTPPGCMIFPLCSLFLSNAFYPSSRSSWEVDPGPTFWLHEEAAGIHPDCVLTVAIIVCFPFLSVLSTHPSQSKEVAAHPELGPAGGFFYYLTTVI